MNYLPTVLQVCVPEFLCPLAYYDSSFHTFGNALKP